MPPRWQLAKRQSAFLLPGCRPCEKILIAYFFYTALLATIHSLGSLRIAIGWLVPVSIWALASAETRYARLWSGVVRDWLSLGFLLAGYWEVNWFSSAPLMRLQSVWENWDRLLLDRFRLRAALEHFGPAIPSALEAIYLLLYLIPVLCMAALYWRRRRDRIETFLMTLFLGSFCAYALLPYFPSISPRLAFPGVELPHFAGAWRSLNVWLLDHLDISTSVFPSGHVAVAFSAAFGLWRALPEEFWLWSGSFVVATAVFTATIYGRYHYAVDGLASIGVAIVAWRISEMVERHA